MAAQGAQDQLAVASMSAHLVLSRASALTITKPDAGAFRDMMSALVAALMSIDDALVPHDRIKKLMTAFDCCIATLEAGSSASSPASVMLLSGPLARRLRENLGEVATALDNLVEAVSPAAGTTPITPSKLRQPQLQALDQRAERAKALWQHLAALKSGGADDAKEEAASVCQALREEGVSAAALEDPQVRSELSGELLELSFDAKGWLSSEESELLVWVAQALLHQEPGSSATGSSLCTANGESSTDDDATPAQAASRPLTARLPLQRSLLCPITQMLMRDPVSTLSGFAYERTAIEAWLRTNDTDPQTRERLTSKTLIPNWTIKGAIDEWLAAAGMDHEGFDNIRENGIAVFTANTSEHGASSSSNSKSENGAGPSCSARPCGSRSRSRSGAAGTDSPAYTIFADVTQWYQVTEVDAAVKEHLKNLGIGPAMAQALTEVLGTISMSDLREGAVEEAHVRLLNLKPLDHRRLVRALMAARELPAPEPGAAPGQSTPRLMDYVTVTSGYASVQDAADGPLCPGKYGIIVMDDRTDDKPLRVRSLQEPYRTWWYPRAALKPIPLQSVPSELRLILPAWEDSMGSPVTPFTSEPGMLVRRGYDWLNPGDTQGLNGEVGMLAESTMGGKMWKVYWANGGEGVYRTGREEKYELQHLQVHPFSGAPVVDEAAVTPGSGVVRGLHWTWQQQDGGSGTIGSVQADERTGFVAALWPNHKLARYRASTAQGFDLNYCSRPGEPVTVFNAQAGLKVVRGRDWKWGPQDEDGSVGVLVRPTRTADEGVWWQVAWASGGSNQYRVGRPSNEWCDLQVATYESAGNTGRILPGTPVLLAPDYARFSDAKDGPIKAGKVGVVSAIGGGEARYKVLHLRTAAQWWYDREALRPLPSKLAAERCKRMKLNREGRTAFLGSSTGGGGDTGKLSKEVFYCGAVLGQCRCGSCDGRCGPSSGCPCHACAELIGKRVTAEGSLADSGMLDAAALLAVLSLAAQEDD